MFDDVHKVALKLAESLRPGLVRGDLLVLEPRKFTGHSGLFKNTLVKLYLCGSTELVPEKEKPYFILFYFILLTVECRSSTHVNR